MSELKDKNNNYETEMPLFDRDLDNENMNTNKPIKNNNILKKAKNVNAENNIALTEYATLTIGAFLQEARVKADYSLNQVAMITKLNIHYIEAIERNDLKNAPPYIYVRAYVKKLSELYNVDQNKALSLLKPYGENDKIVSDSILQELEESKQINEKEEKKIVFIMKTSLVAFVIVLIICIVFFVFFPGKSSKEVPKVAQNSTVDKKQIQKDMEKLIVPQTLTPTQLKVPNSK